MSGGEGNDFFEIINGKDHEIYGDDGDDQVILDSTEGNNSILLGIGNDVAFFLNSVGVCYLDGGEGVDTIVVPQQIRSDLRIYKLSQDNGEIVTVIENLVSDQTIYAKQVERLITWSGVTPLNSPDAPGLRFNISPYDWLIGTDGAYHYSGNFTINGINVDGDVVLQADDSAIITGKFFTDSARSTVIFDGSIALSKTTARGTFNSFSNTVNLPGGLTYYPAGIDLSNGDGDLRFAGG